MTNTTLPKTKLIQICQVSPNLLGIPKNVGNGLPKG